MRTIIQFNNDILFYPGYDAKEWEQDWLRELMEFLPTCCQNVNQYINLKQLPKLVFISKDSCDEFIRQNMFPSWTKAVCCKNTLYLLINNTTIRWREILTHEFFHVAIFQMYSDSIIIPVWFNEAVAYYLGSNFKYKKEELLRFLNDNFLSVKHLLLEDTLLKRSKISLAIIKSFGQYFCIQYHPKVIRNLFELTKMNNDFKKAYSVVFNISLDEEIDRWYIYLINSEKQKMSY